MSAEDWHGICFANGMSGRCNINCEQFIDGDCESEDETLLGSLEELDIDLMETACDRYLPDIIKYIKSQGLYFNYQILKQQTKTALTEPEIIIQVFKK